MPDREITVPEHIYDQLTEIGASLLDLLEDDNHDEMFTVRAVRTLDGPERKAIEGTQP